VTRQWNSARRNIIPGYNTWVGSAGFPKNRKPADPCPLIKSIARREYPVHANHIVNVQVWLLDVRGLALAYDTVRSTGLVPLWQGTKLAGRNTLFEGAFVTAARGAEIALTLCGFFVKTALTLCKK